MTMRSFKPTGKIKIVPSRPTAVAKPKKRILGDIIDGYLEFAKNTEPPTSFHRWTALGSIAAALQRKCYMDWGLERIYPNVYFVLLGDAALTRKSTAVKIGEALVKSLSIQMIGQANSPEAIIRDIRNSQHQFYDNDILKFQSAAVCFASELAVFLGRQNIVFQADLTDWFDSPDEWKYTTKHQGIDDIVGMCFNLIGAMAPDWIPHVFSPESIGGGFTSRIVFICESKKGKTVADPNMFPADEKLRSALYHDLEMVSEMVGPFTLSPGAKKFYVEWYEAEDIRMGRGDFPVADNNFRHYCGRRGTLLRKLSMLVSASRGESREVSRADISWALNNMEDVESRMPGIFSSVGRSSTAFQGALVQSVLSVRKEMLRSELLRQVHSDVSLTDLEEIEKTLTASKLIKVTILTATNDVSYKWLG